MPQRGNRRNVKDGATKSFSSSSVAPQGQRSEPEGSYLWPRMGQQRATACLPSGGYVRCPFGGKAVCAPKGTTTSLLFPSGSLLCPFVLQSRTPSLGGKGWGKSFALRFPPKGEQTANQRGNATDDERRARTPQRGVNYGDATLSLCRTPGGGKGWGNKGLYPLWGYTEGAQNYLFATCCPKGKGSWGNSTLLLCPFRRNNKKAPPSVCVIAPKWLNRGAANLLVKLKS